MNVVNSRLSDVTPACTSPDDSEETDVDDEEEPELLCTVKSDSSRYTLYKEKIGYSDFRTHREMELYLQALHGDREVVARISHFLPPAPKARTVSFRAIAFSKGLVLTSDRDPLTLMKTGRHDLGYLTKPLSLMSRKYASIQTILWTQ